MKGLDKGAVWSARITPQRFCARREDGTEDEEPCAACSTRVYGTAAGACHAV